jgi:hypothetical protein
MQSCLPPQLVHASARHAVLADLYNICGTLRDDYTLAM